MSGVHFDSEGNVDMRAYVWTRYGDMSALELRDVPEPAPGPGEVLVRVRAAGLNPIDHKILGRASRVLFRIDLPRAAGSELSGVVERVGAGVTRFAVGDRVFTRVDKEKLGAFAEFAVVEEDLVAMMPESLDFADAAGIPLAGLTALQGLRELGVAAGDRVFISAGAGGVGTLAIQLAVWMGARVATTASPRGEELVRSLGAETVVNYRERRFKDLLHDYDGALDLTGGQDLTDSFDILKRGAKAVSVASLPDPTTAREDLNAGPALTALAAVASAGSRRQARRKGVGYRAIFMRPGGKDLEELAELIDKGELKPVTDQVFPFARIADAFAYLKDGHAKGKVVVQF